MSRANDDASARFTSPASVRFDVASGSSARSPASVSSVPSPTKVVGSKCRTPGVEVKTFRQADDGDSTLVRLRPGAALEASAGALGEEFLVVDGEAFFGDTLLRGGEYQFAPAGSRPRAVTSDVGALLYRRGGQR